MEVLVIRFPAASYISGNTSDYNILDRFGMVPTGWPRQSFILNRRGLDITSWTRKFNDWFISDRFLSRCACPSCRPIIPRDEEGKDTHLEYRLPSSILKTLSTWNRFIFYHTLFPTQVQRNCHATIFSAHNMFDCFYIYWIVNYVRRLYESSDLEFLNRLLSDWDISKVNKWRKLINIPKL